MTLLWLTLSIGAFYSVCWLFNTWLRDRRHIEVFINNIFTWKPRYKNHGELSEIVCIFTWLRWTLVKYNIFELSFTVVDEVHPFKKRIQYLNRTWGFSE